MANKLIHETSPYLLQHANNPVNWYSWGAEALQKAKEEDKPILISIGYAACHWCHVMERESFEDEATAAIMNEHFINIKIDREERPDIDHIYMDAVQAMTGSGGWPLNVFLTPDKKPFYGGTYFPPQPVMNRPSWKDVLLAVADAFTHKRANIEQQADGMTAHLQKTNSFGISTDGKNLMSIELADTACNNLLSQADVVWGGFGNAPKFPQTFSIQFLLHYYFIRNNHAETNASKALEQALLSIDKMIDGGINDQLGGGFARYATDKEWLVPHFEKMLYDNALIVSTICEACQFTKKEKYLETIKQTLAFVERELLDAGGGFYAALDADSEGVEGEFYTWNEETVRKVIGKNADVFMSYYDITPSGNWDGTNILRVLKTPDIFAAEMGIEVNELKKILQAGKQKLLNERSKRVRPALDDKIILSWNALMNIAFCKAYATTGNESYKSRAIDNMQFILQAFTGTNGRLSHVWKNGVAKYPAFLDDYAYLIQALLQLQKVTGDVLWLEKAKGYCEQVIKDFSDNNGFFYYTMENQLDVIVRKKELYDGATPSGNALMAQNLLELGILLDKENWQQRAQTMIAGVGDVIVKYPVSFGMWLQTLLQQLTGTKEIVLMGDYEKPLKELLTNYLPGTIIMAAHKQNITYPLLAGKKPEEPFAIYLCENYACKKPVTSVSQLLENINIKNEEV